MFEYALNDFLELKGFSDMSKSGPLKEFLHTQSAAGLPLNPVAGFYLGRQLVVLGEEDPAVLQNLVLVKPSDGRLCIKQIR